jgi:hypothetical protein
MFTNQSSLDLRNATNKRIRQFFEPGTRYNQLMELGKFKLFTVLFSLIELVLIFELKSLVDIPPLLKRLLVFQ